MGLLKPDRLGLTQPSDKPGEWWVTLNGKCVIGFAGQHAHARAERHFEQLVRIASALSFHYAGADR